MPIFIKLTICKYGWDEMIFVTKTLFIMRTWSVTPNLRILYSYLNIVYSSYPRPWWILRRGRRRSGGRTAGSRCGTPTATGRRSAQTPRSSRYSTTTVIWRWVGPLIEVCYDYIYFSKVRAKLVVYILRHYIGNTYTSVILHTVP